jgi:hypothetical protein
MCTWSPAFRRSKTCQLFRGRAFYLFFTDIAYFLPAGPYCRARELDLHRNYISFYRFILDGPLWYGPLSTLSWIFRGSTGIRYYGSTSNLIYNVFTPAIKHIFICRASRRDPCCWWPWHRGLIQSWMVGFCRRGICSRGNFWCCLRRQGKIIFGIFGWCRWRRWGRTCSISGSWRFPR